MKGCLLSRGNIFTFLRLNTLRSRRHSCRTLQRPVRTRFAPSPTGSLHLGSLRTALYNYLLAKSCPENDKGKFVLRIEDTDAKRSTTDGIKNIIDDLKWAELAWDEGPDVGGPFGPYIQSLRTNFYTSAAQTLLETGHAYRCFCSTERLERIKSETKKNHCFGTYDRHCESISTSTISEFLNIGKRNIIRLKCPKHLPNFRDHLRGNVESRLTYNQYFPDPVLVKSDGLPTYHLASVVDDHLMHITHVIRGEEWLSSTPFHILLYDAFGWEKPVYVHLPLLLNESGGKLSKRKGDVTIKAFRDSMYQVEPLLNYLALYGWGHHETSDILTLSQLTKKFSLDGLTKGQITVTRDKLDFLSREHLKHAVKDEAKLCGLVRTIADYLDKFVISRSNHEQQALVHDRAYITKILKHGVHKMTTLQDFFSLYYYFFLTPNYESDNYKTYKEELQRQGEVEKIANCLIEFSKIESINMPWTTEYILKQVKIFALGCHLPFSKIAMALRMACTGQRTGGAIAEILEILGQKTTIERIQLTVRCLETQFKLENKETPT